MPDSTYKPVAVALYAQGPSGACPDCASIECRAREAVAVLEARIQDFEATVDPTASRVKMDALLGQSVAVLNQRQRCHNRQLQLLADVVRRWMQRS